MTCAALQRVRVIDTEQAERTENQPQRHWVMRTNFSRERTSTIQRRGRKGCKGRMYSFAAFAAFAFPRGVIQSDGLLT